MIDANPMVDSPKVQKLGPKSLLLGLVSLLRGLLGGVLAHVFEKALHVFLRRRGHPGDEGHFVVFDGKMKFMYL